MRSMARRSRKSLSGAVKRKPSTSPFVPRIDLIFQEVKKSVSLRAGELRGGPAAPEKIGRKPHSKQDYGCGEVLELRRIAERQVHGVTDDGRSRKDKENRRPGISGNSIRRWLAATPPANGKDGCRSRAIQNPANENHALSQFWK